MSTPIAYSTLLSAVLLSSCSSPMPADARPEVAQPLHEAKRLSLTWMHNKSGTPDTSAAIIAKLNQAASVPNLNSDERHQIVITRDYTLSKVGRFGGGFPVAGDADAHPLTSMPDYSQHLGYTGLR